MNLKGIHLLLTYKCTSECDHCFVWGSPRQSGVMTLEQIHEILNQARELDTVEWVYFEGGEPFLFYPILLRGVQMATAMGFRVGIVTNAYWAISKNDAEAWLKPFADLIEDLTVSCDQYHGSDINPSLVENTRDAAKELKIPFGLINVTAPEKITNELVGKLPEGDSAVMFRGRAARKLTKDIKTYDWASFTTCPHEDLVNPERMHIDPFGNLHICQGISLGNIFENSLQYICRSYYAESNPVCGPLLKNGPAGLVNEYQLVHSNKYADACHLCDESRRLLRTKFPDILTPDQMYFE